MIRGHVNTEHCIFGNNTVIIMSSNHWQFVEEYMEDLNNGCTPGNLTPGRSYGFDRSLEVYVYRENLLFRIEVIRLHYI